MKTLNILHLGIGNVGKEVVRQITEQKENIIHTFGVSLNYKATFTSKNSEDEVFTAIQQASVPCVLIDTTASEKTLSFLQQTFGKGGFVVLANKKPLTGSQKDFDELHQLGKQRVFYETTVGAGLPVIHTLKNLLATGDEVIEIKGCFSGTVGYIFSELEKDRLFSDIVVDAKAKGYTEPDPRDDLSGIDVARKALILSRILGRKIELEDISVEKLFTSEMEQLSIDEFLNHVPTLDEAYKKKTDQAQKENKVLRYVATITPTRCTVDLQSVSKHSELGNLRGPDNIIVFKTKRYFTQPLVIKGPGAGIEVTAAGVFGDVIEGMKMLR